MRGFKKTKLLAMMLTAAISVSILAAPVCNAAEEEKLLGDVDGNGIVNILDCTVIAAYLADFDVEIDVSVADYDHDGRIGILDASEICKYCIATYDKNDANQDGYVNIYDASFISKLLMNKSEEVNHINIYKTYLGSGFGDTNQDGTINIYDAAVVAKSLVKK